jgi:hypothetical protein
LWALRYYPYPRCQKSFGDKPTYLKLYHLFATFV